MIVKRNVPNVLGKPYLAASPFAGLFYCTSLHFPPMSQQVFVVLLNIFGYLPAYFVLFFHTKPSARTMLPHDNRW